MKIYTKAFYIYLRTLETKRGKFSSTVLDTCYIKYCSVLLQYYKIYLNFLFSFISEYKKAILLHLIFWDFMRPKMCA